MVMSSESMVDLDALSNTDNEQLLTPPSSIYFTEQSMGSSSKLGQVDTNQLLLPSMHSCTTVHVTSAATVLQTEIIATPVSAFSAPQVLMQLPRTSAELTVVYPCTDSTPSLNKPFVPAHPVTTRITYEPSTSFQQVSCILPITQFDTSGKSKASYDLPSKPSEVGQNHQARKHRGRPRLPTRNLLLIYNPSDDPSIASAQQHYHPDYFWCPLCQWYYTPPTLCPEHPVVIQPDNEVISYARQSLPKCFKLSEKHGITRVRFIKRQAPMTRFGPLIAPLLTEEDLRSHPEWLPDCPFRIDMQDSNGHSVRYLKLGDEALCNWMMFVRVVSQKFDQLNGNDSIPNAVAYQLGSAGIFFLLTRSVLSGEELIVTYSPPYATHFELPVSIFGFESVAASLERPVQHRSFPDEVHCFQCALTFDSEDAFRVHCLGHQGELSLRGIPTKPVSANHRNTSVDASQPIDTPGPSSASVLHIPGDGNLESGNTLDRLNPVQSTLRCSLCAIEVGGVMDLIKHTNSDHSVSRPRIFATSRNLSLPGAIQCSSVERLAIDENEFDKPDVSVDKNLVIVDLGQLSSDVCDDLPVAYGCGKCGLRLPSMQALQIHKEIFHGNHPRNDQGAGSAHSNLGPSYGADDVNMNLSFLNETEQPACSLSPLRMVLAAEGWNHTGTDPLDVLGPSDLLFSSSNKDIVGDTNKKTLAMSFVCSVCALEVRSRSALSVHMRTHKTAMHLQQASDCPTNHHPESESTAVSCVEKRSMQLRPREPRLPLIKQCFFSCSVCGKGQKSQKALRQHSNVHRRSSDNRYPCPLCAAELNRSYETFQQLQRHIGFVHRPKELFPCPYCERTFGRRLNLDNHIVRHTGRRDFVCPYDTCKKGFGRKDKLKLHLRTHERVTGFRTENFSQYNAKRPN